MRNMQLSLLGTQAVGDRELGRRYYHLANCAIKLTSEGATAEEGKQSVPVHEPKRLSELLSVIERGVTSAMRLNPRLASAYIDAEMLAKWTHPADQSACVRMHADLVAEACASRKFWVDPLQRPMHFYPKLRSQPWCGAPPRPRPGWGAPGPSPQRQS